jgi:lytic murein transglycosylase
MQVRDRPIFTSPRRGEVAARSAAGEGVTIANIEQRLCPPHPTPLPCGEREERADASAPTLRVLAASLLLWLVLLAVSTPVSAADPAFRQWLEALWPDAQAFGISRKTFDAATAGVEPDLSLPDLDVPGRPAPQREQPEFVLRPADYLKEATLARLAGEGRKLLAEYGATLHAIEQQFGVPPTVVLAIWGRESAYSRGYRPGNNAIRVLATQAYLGRRKDVFRQELLFALKMVEDGEVKLSEMRSSWAGAMGLTQFLPSEFYKYAVDFDGDGRRDIWNSVPDALASAAKQLAEKGWRKGQRWAYEVRVPKAVDCTLADPEQKLPIAAWVRRGFAPAFDRKLSAEEQAQPASLLLPAGIYGPGFLILPNYFVLKEYNFSDLYVLFVGQLSDRILDARAFETPWAEVVQLKTGALEEMQRRLTELGYYFEKIDGKAGMKTRLALGAYQKANGLKLDCWPTAAVLDHMRGRTGRN